MRLREKESTMSEQFKLDKRNIQDIFSLTPMQEGMLFHYLKNPGSDLYVEQLALDVTGEIDRERFEKAWNFVIASNDMLRAVFNWDKVKNPVQVILKEHKLQPIYYDITGKTALAEKKKKQVEVEEIIAADRANKFHLQEVPFRITLCRIQDNTYKMIISNHHILYDGWSNGILLEEFFRAYNDLSMGREPVKPVKTTFKEFIKWSRSHEGSKQEEFQDRFLNGFTPLPGDLKKRRKKEIVDTGEFHFTLAQDVKDSLDNYTKTHKVTLSSVLYSAWALVLQSIHSPRDVIFDTTVSGRNADVKGIEDIVGLFINTLPLRVQTLENETAADFLSRLEEILRQRSEFENVSLFSLNEYLETCNQANLFDSVVVLENYPLDRLLLQKNSALTVNGFSNTGRTRYDMTIIITIFDDIRLSFTYNNELFDEALIRLLTEKMVEIITALTTHPGMNMSGITPLAEEIRNRIAERCQQRDAAETEMIQAGEFRPRDIRTAPLSGTAGKLADIWADLFRVDKVSIGMDTNFFDFGGHSLKASLLTAKIHRSLDVRVPLVEIFRNPTIRELAQFIAGMKPDRDAYHPLNPVEKKEYYQTSPGQKRLFMLHQLEEGSTVYNGPAVMLLEGSVDKDAILQSFRQLVRRHESLRTFFHMIGGEPVQGIREDEEIKFDIRCFDDTEENRKQIPGKTETDYSQFIIRHFMRPFDLACAPLLRVGLLKPEADKYLLMVDMHHIITDGTSMDVLTREFARIYQELELLPLKIQYKEFSGWLNKRLKSGELNHQEAYWLAQLSGELPVLDMPSDFPRPMMQSFAGERIHFQLDAPLTRQLNRLIKETDTTLYMVLLAVYSLVLGRYSGQEDIIIGTPCAGRNHADLEETIGFFLETLAIRCFPAGEKSFDYFLAEIRTHTLAAYENQDYPFRELIKKLEIEMGTGKKMSGGGDLSRNPLFDAMLNVLNQDRADLDIEHVIVHPLDFDARVAKVDLTLEATETTDKIALELEYCTALFSRQTIQRLSQHIVNTLQEIVRHPHCRLAEIRIINEKEKLQILEEFNTIENTITGNKTVIDYFTGQVDRNPDHIALLGQIPGPVNETNDKPGTETSPAPKFNRFTQVHLSYKELNRKANGLAHLLREKGVGPDTIVAIIAERSVDMITGITGILKSGGAYLPVDPEYPRERIQFMLCDSAARVLVTTTKKYETDFPGIVNNVNNDNSEIEIICLSPKFKFENTSAINPLPPTPTAGSLYHHLAYVIYTSGSTGRPKGVLVNHKNLVSYLFSFEQEFTITSKDVVLQQASFSFDAFAEEVFPCLVNGGKLALPSKDEVRDVTLLSRFITLNNVSMIDCSPLLLNELNRLCPDNKKNPINTIHTFISGGDVLKSEYVDNLLEIGNVYNTYGPTETTICATYHKLNRTSVPDIPIGKPIANYQVYILNQYLQLTPIGVPGEICIAGTGVTRGYLNQPDLTAEKFCLWQPGGSFYKNCPLDPRKNFLLDFDIIYRAGDVGKWLGDGRIEFLGRMDRQVNIRGFRIELNEIENQLISDEDIEDAFITAAKDHSLCAYFISKKEKNSRELRDFLSLKLPDFMVPAYFVQLDRFPRNSQGKINTRALPEPKDNLIKTGSTYKSPGNDIEKKLVGTWKELLGLKRIGTEDDFFELGGDSIMANQCIARIRDMYQVDVSLRKFFEQPYIYALAREIQNQERKAISIPRASRRDFIPLSFAQERLWFIQELNAENIAYFVPRVITIKGTVEKHIFERTFTEIIRRHEILRTRFLTREGIPIQQIDPPSEFKIPLLDWSSIPEPQQSQQVTAWLRQEGQRKFNFITGPMMRVTLLKLKSFEHLLVLTEHHLIHDGWTQGVLLKEFIEIFTAYSQNQEHALPELPIQYADFAIWQREFIQGARLEHHLAYWKEKLTGLPPVLELPTDSPRPIMISGQGAMMEFHLSAALTHDSKEFSRKNDVTLFMTMLAVFKTLLYRYTGAEDLCVGTGIANRRYKEMEGMLGMVINSLPLRTRLAAEVPFSQLLLQLKETCLESYQHEDTPFGKIVEAMQPERSLSYSPLFQVMFNFMDTPTTDMQLPGLELHLQESHNRSAKFDIHLVVVPPVEEENGQILIEWEYNTDIFEQQTMERMINHYLQLLETALNNPEEQISQLPMLSTRETRQLLYEFNQTDEDYPLDKTIQQLFQERAEKTPDHTALIGSDRLQELQKINRLAITYRELNRRSDILAQVLGKKDFTGNSITALMMERSPEMVMVILGILKSGQAYLPIDIHYPRDRSEYILADSKAHTLLTTRALAEKTIQKLELEIIFVDDIDFSEINESWSRLPHIAPPHPTHLAYTLYTSGSTGRPKGVMVEQCSVVNTLTALDRAYPFTPADVYLLKTRYTFDISVTELFGWFFGYGRLALLEPGGEKDSEITLNTIESEHVTHINFVPSMFAVFIEHLNRKNIRKITGLKYIFFGGEALWPQLVKDFRQLNTGICLEDLYGPTEAAIYATGYHLSAWNHEGDVPIGKPLANVTIYILARNKAINNFLQPIGVPGELFISGAGLARGYLNRPELTSISFLCSWRGFLDKNLPVCGSRKNSQGSRQRIYKTGDLARWLADGNIEFLGRLDHQIKIRGFRIELGEIENQLLCQEEIKEAIVVAGEEQNTGKYLAAYVVARAGSDISIPALKEKLLKALPDYMVPDYFVRLEKMPLTSSGKTDRRALPLPEAKTDTQYVAPGNELERKLVDIWSEVLGRDAGHVSQLKSSIGIHDNFFILGGHSLNAARVAAKMHKAFNIYLPLVEMFKRPNIKKLSAYITEAAEDRYGAIEAAEKREYYVLSSAQKRLYVLQQMDEQGIGENTGKHGKIAYNISIVLAVTGELQRKKLTETVTALIARHESFRTSFLMMDEEPVQRISPGNHWEDGAVIGLLTAEDLSQVSHIIKSFIQPFDLSEAPLLRVGLIKLTKPGQEQKQGDHILIIDMHHIISDGISSAVLAREFMEVYSGHAPEPLKIQYKDYARWKTSLKEKEKLNQQEQWWLKEFPGEIPVLNLPLDFPRPPVQSFIGSRLTFETAPEELKTLRNLAFSEGTTLYMVLLAAYSLLLSRLSGQEHIVIGAPVGGRRHPDLEPVIGMFVNTLALRTHPAGYRTVSDFLQEIKEKTLAAFENQEYPFEDLVEQVAASRDTSRNPLFDAAFILQNVDIPGLEVSGLTFTPYPVDNKTSKFDLTLQAFELDTENEHQGEKRQVTAAARGKIKFVLEYCTRLFREATIRRFITYFKKILADVAAAPGKKLSRLEIISPAEKREIIMGFNATVHEYPADKTIYELFSRQAERTPDHAALVGDFQVDSAGGSRETVLTYSELYKHSGRLAGQLTAKGLQPGSIVGIKLDPSVEMITGILGIIEAGGVYLPIDPDYPEERIRFMLSDSASKLLLTRKEIAGLSASAPISAPVPAPERETSAAYVIYTSGSTGRPKGVMVGHRALVNLCFWHNRCFSITAADRATKIAGFGFDASVWETFPYLIVGACLYLVPAEIRLDLPQLNHYFEQHQITAAFLPTQLCEQFLTLKNRSLRLLLTGGDKLKKYSPTPYLLVNNYGPTENTVVTTSFPVTADCGNIPIGSPIDNCRVFIIDNYFHLQPVGIAGDLCIGGDGLAMGYVNNPELTAERFFKFKVDIESEGKTVTGEVHINGNVINSLKSVASSSYRFQVYRTGDLARWLPGGNIEFFGRIDNQVKIRGFRIELGEIENLLSAHHAVAQAVVIDREHLSGDRYLCAYIVPGELFTRTINIMELREYLSHTLPDFMVPAYFVFLDKIPLTAHGKIHRQALPAPELQGKEAYAAPRNQTEETLVKIWTDVLGRAVPIGIDDNFFDIGGHSLKATRLITRIHKELNIKVPLAKVFKNPTIRGISRFIKTTGQNIYSAIAQMEKKEYYPVSSAQKRMFILHLLKGHDTSDNTPYAVLVDGQLDKQRFEQVIHQLINRHEPLRTSFHLREETPVQRIHREADFKMEYYRVELKTGIDLSGEIPGELKAILKRFIRPFDLGGYPLLRVGLVRLSAQRHLLMYDIHHIIRDGTASWIFIREFTDLYKGNTLPALRIQYKDFTVWQNRMLDSEIIKKQESYWLEVFSGPVPVLDMPVDFPRPAVQSFEGDYIELRLAKEKTEKVRQLALAHGATIYMVLLAVYTILLSKYSGQEDIVVGAPIAGRPHADLETLIGMFVNTLAMRNFPNPERTFAQFLEDVKENALKAYENQDYQFEALVTRLGIPPDPARQSLFDTMFAVQNMDRHGLDSQDQLIKGLFFKRLKIEEKITQFDIMFHAFEGDDFILFRLLYCTRLFKPETIRLFIRNFLEIIDIVTNEKHILLKGITITHGLFDKQIEVPEAEFEF